jgi:hypothetical protein
VKFTYLLGAFYFSVIWMVLFGLFPKERKVIFWSSLACGPAGPISEYWHRADYWRPDLIIAIHFGNWTFGLEDYLFAFVFGGICTGIFDLLMRRIWQAEDIRFNFKGFIKLLSIVLFSLMLMGAQSWLFHLNSLPAISISFILIAGTIFYRRSTFLFPGLATGLLMMFFMWLFYWCFFLRLYPDVIDRWWLSNALSGITLAKVPLEELIWAGSAGLFIGPAVRFSLLTSKCS